MRADAMPKHQRTHSLTHQVTTTSPRGCTLREEGVVRLQGACLLVGPYLVSRQKVVPRMCPARPTPR